MRCRGHGWPFAAITTLALISPSCGNAAFDLLVPADGDGGPDANVDGSENGGASGMGDAAPSTAGSAGVGIAGAAGGTSAGGAGQCADWNCGSDVCSPFGIVCDRCDADFDCPDVAPHCDVTFRRCVQCTGNAECGLGMSCDPLSGSCAPSCATTEDCESDRPLCDQARGICVECTEDAHCRTSVQTPFCVIGKCVECFGSQQCPSTAPYCRGFYCHECTESWQCGDGLMCSEGSCQP
ncbi:MAG TPA: hypothetical protein VGP93_07830 [Polyangiaceae bacterium]|nr:hypothetical protein [Polyangiaceae bacterium]